MPRKKLLRTSEFPYHITNRSNNREFFYVDLEKLWFIFMDCLGELRVQYNCRIHSFVLMSNHYHLLISTPDENIGEAMKYLHREVARKSNRDASRINHFFGGRYKWSVVNQDLYYWNVVKYIFRNPVRAGMCSSVSEYSFSSLNRRDKKLIWSMVDFFLNKEKFVELDLDWLNEAFLSEEEDAIRIALRHREFSLPRNSKGKLQHLKAIEAQV